MRTWITTLGELAGATLLLSACFDVSSTFGKAVSGALLTAICWAASR